MIDKIKQAIKEDKVVRGLYDWQFDDDIAYYASSSGTTGKPKNIPITWENMKAWLESAMEAYGFKPGEKHMRVLPMTHASGLYRSFLLPKMCGCSIHVPIKGYDFWDELRTHRIDFVQVVPSMLISLSMGNGPDPKRRLSDQIVIGCASDALPKGFKQKFDDRFGVPIWESYGLTETTCGVTLNKTAKDGPGMAMPGVQIAATEGSGRIFISGKMVTRTTDDAHGVIITTDIGRIDEDGYLHITGRMSDVITRNGVQISPHEVEEDLLEVDGIDRCCCFGVPSEVMGQDVIVYAEGTFSEDEAIKSVHREEARPTRILNRQLIYNDIGKVDRKAMAKDYDEWGPAIETLQELRQTSSQHSVTLRPMTRKEIDSAIYRKNIRDPERQMLTRVGRFPQSDSEIERYKEGFNLPHSMEFAIYDAEDYAGNFSLRIDWISRTGEFGRFIFAEFSGREHLVYDATKQLIDYCFGELGLSKMWGGGCNAASLPSLYRLGFKLEGTLRNHLFFKGEYHDVFQVGLKRGPEYPCPFCDKEKQCDQTQDIAETVQATIESIVSERVDSGTRLSNYRKWSSLSAARACVLIGEQLGIRVPMSVFIGEQTVNEIVSKIKEL